MFRPPESEPKNAHDVFRAGEPPRRRDPATAGRTGSKGSWLAVLLLALALAALAAYGYITLGRQDLQLAQLPSLHNALKTMAQQLEKVQGNLAALANENGGLRERLSKVEHTVRLNLKRTQAYAQELTQQLRAEMEARTRALDTRLQNVESQQTAQQSRVAHLETQLHDEIGALQDETKQNLSDLEARVNENSRDLEVVSARTNPERVEFELHKGRTGEVVSGVSMHVTKTYVSHQLFDAWLELLPEGRRLWVRAQAADRPVRFYRKEGGQAYELVVTDVTKDFVLGYVLVPARPAETRSSSAAAGTDAGSH